MFNQYTLAIFGPSLNRHTATNVYENTITDKIVAYSYLSTMAQTHRKN